MKLEPVEVEIHSIDILRCEGNELDARVHCGSGTYLRSIAHDLGQILGPGGIPEGLRRTASGGFDLQMARTLEELASLAEQGRIAEALIPAADLLPEFPSEHVDAATAGSYVRGGTSEYPHFASARSTRYVKAVSHEGELLAIGEAKLPNVYHPILVL